MPRWVNWIVGIAILIIVLWAQKGFWGMNKSNKLQVLLKVVIWFLVIIISLVYYSLDHSFSSSFTIISSQVGSQFNLRLGESLIRYTDVFIFIVSLVLGFLIWVLKPEIVNRHRSIYLYLWFGSVFLIIVSIFLWTNEFKTEKTIFASMFKVIYYQKVSNYEFERYRMGLARPTNSIKYSISESRDSTIEYYKKYFREMNYPYQIEFDGLSNAYRSTGGIPGHYNQRFQLNIYEGSNITGVNITD